MTLRRLLLPTMIAAALAVPASAQDVQNQVQGQGQGNDARKADPKAAQARKDAQATPQKDRKAEDADKARKARAEQQPDEPEEDDR